MGVNAVFLIALVSTLVVAVMALKCYQCGQYNDGVGSITPCINETHMVLKECPKQDAKYCIKFISEGTTVRDCVPACIEKDLWGSQTFCCDEDGCNHGVATQASWYLATSGVLVLIFRAH